jgi:tetratricopeptide (TPR) repeat protein
VVILVVLFVRPLLLVLSGAAAASLNAATFEDLSARATAAREANRLPEAVRLYREAVAANPKWQEGWWFLGTISYDTNRYGECRDALSHLVALKADAAPALGILGLCEFQTGDYALSLKHIENSLALGSTDEPDMEKVLRYHEALLLTHAGEFDEAIRKYVWFVRSSGPSPVLLTAIGLAALRTPLLPSAIPQDQQDLFLTAGRAAFDQMSGDAAGAQEMFQTLLARYPAAHHVHYLYGCWLLAANPSRAIAEFKRELENTPSSAGTLGMLAWVLVNRGDARAALPYAERAARIQPKYALAQYVLGRSMVETGAVEAGIPHLELAVKMEPANLEYHLALTEAYPKAHRYADARRERKKCMALAQEAPVAQH